MLGKCRFLLLTVVIVLLCSPAYAAQNSFFSDPADITITDGIYDGSSGSMVSDAIDTSGPIPAGSTITDVTVELSISHTWIGDLTIKLESPNGTVLTLMSRPGYSETADDGTGCCGASGDLVAIDIITFSDPPIGVTNAENMGAGGVVCSGDGLCFYFPNPDTGPGIDFSDFAGEDPSGIWTLYVGDSSNADTGTLDSWTLIVDYDAPVDPVAIPTLSEWGMIIMSLMMAGSACWMIRRRTS